MRSVLLVLLFILPTVAFAEESCSGSVHELIIKSDKLAQSVRKQGCRYSSRKQRSDVVNMSRELRARFDCATEQGENGAAQALKESSQRLNNAFGEICANLK